MGRPTKLTPETQKRFIDGLRLGLTYALASSYAGVSMSTFSLWMQKGADEEDTIYSAFSAAVKAAEGLCAAQHMGRITKAAEGGQWQASGWVMERRYGYSQRQEVKIGAADDSLEGAEDLIAKVAEVAEALKAGKAGEDGQD